MFDLIDARCNHEVSQLNFLTTWKSTTLLFWSVMLTVQSSSFVNKYSYGWQSPKMKFHDEFSFMFVLKEGKTNMECNCGYRIYCQTPRMPADSMWPDRQKRREHMAGRRIKNAVSCYSRVLTSHVQPPYVLINKSFQALMCEKCIKWTDELWVTTPRS